MTTVPTRMTAVLLAALLVSEACGAPTVPLRIEPIGVYATGVYDQSSAEISAYDPASKRLFVVNATQGVDVLDLTDPTQPRRVATLVHPGVNSVAVHNGRVALAIEGLEVDAPGTVAVYDAVTGVLVVTVAAGPQPDMLCFSPDGSLLAVANEAEPRAERDAAGSITLIDSRFFTSRTFGFAAAIQRFGTAELRVAPRHAADPARDLEPEYLAFSPDGRLLIVGLQENNAVAVIDVAAGAVTGFCGLGWVDHSALGSGLDPSDSDDGVHLINAPVRGLRQPDAIGIHVDAGRLYLLTANEGDPRTDGSDEVRVGDLPLDPDAFPASEDWDAPSRLGRLTVSRVDGDPDDDSDFDALYAFGGRSFSVFTLDPTSGGGAAQIERVFDSGDAFERLTATLAPAGFNAGGGLADRRSDDRGPEPEGLCLGRVDGTPYVFVGLERADTVTAWDLSDPASPSFAGHANVRDLSEPVSLPGGASNPAAGDLAPEGLTFIDAAASPSGEPLLVVANEVSGTVRIFAVRPRVPATEPGPADPR